MSRVASSRSSSSTTTMVTARSVDDDEILNWGFDTIAVHIFSGARSLSYVTSRIFRTSQALLSGHADAVHQLGRFFAQVEIEYNPSAFPAPAYHNVIHGADVTQALNYFLVGPPNLIKRVSGENVGVVFMGAIFAAAMHDFDHPGVTNEFLIQTRNPLALRYNDESVLENYHAASALRSLETYCGSSVLGLCPKEYRFFRKLVVEMILSTDLSRHADVLSCAEYSWRQSLCLALHCADVSNSARPVAVCEKWTLLVWSEFSRQAELETRNSMSLTGIEKLSTRKGQVSFIDNICRPLFLKIPNSDECLRNLDLNRNISL